MGSFGQCDTCLEGRVAIHTKVTSATKSGVRQTVIYESTIYGVPWLRRNELLAAASKEKLDINENYASVVMH
jgi:hypothetical protein